MDAVVSEPVFVEQMNSRVCKAPVKKHSGFNTDTDPDTVRARRRISRLLTPRLTTAHREEEVTLATALALAAWLTLNSAGCLFDIIFTLVVTVETAWPDRKLYAFP